MDGKLWNEVYQVVMRLDDPNPTDNVTHDESPEVLQLTDRALDLPATAVATQGTAILGSWQDAVATVWAHQLDTAPLEPATQRRSTGLTIPRRRTMADSTARPPCQHRCTPTTVRR